MGRFTRTVGRYRRGITSWWKQERARSARVVAEWACVAVLIAPLAIWAPWPWWARMLGCFGLGAVMAVLGLLLLADEASKRAERRAIYQAYLRSVDGQVRRARRASEGEGRRT